MIAHARPDYHHVTYTIMTTYLLLSGKTHTFVWDKIHTFVWENMHTFVRVDIYTLSQTAIMSSEKCGPQIGLFLGSQRTLVYQHWVVSWASTLRGSFWGGNMITFGPMVRCVVRVIFRLTVDIQHQESTGDSKHWNPLETVKFRYPPYTANIKNPLKTVSIKNPPKATNIKNTLKTEDPKNPSKAVNIKNPLETAKIKNQMKTLNI